MLQCWHWKADDGPSFVSLTWIISTFFEEEEDEEWMRRFLDGIVESVTETSGSARLAKRWADTLTAAWTGDDRFERLTLKSRTSSINGEAERSRCWIGKKNRSGCRAESGCRIRRSCRLGLSRCWRSRSGECDRRLRRRCAIRRRGVIRSRSSRPVEPGPNCWW